MTAAWVTLGLVLIAGFTVLETIGVRMQEKGHTCSATLRRWFHTTTVRGRTVWIIVCGLIFAAEVWFVAHILSPGLVWWP
jgi:hypothetical protein